MKPVIAAIACAVTLSCHPRKTPDTEPEPLPYTYEVLADRSLDLSAPRGWIVNRFDDGSLRDPGDSLIFTGIAMGVLDCIRGAVPEQALTDMLTIGGYGGLYRHPTLGEATADGALGLYWGIHRRVAKCPETRQRWAGLLQMHAPVAPRYLEGVFEPVLYQVMADVGLRAPPSEEERGILGTAMSAWALGVVRSKSAAYRLHLGFLALDVVDAPRGKVAYCEAISAAKMPLLEHFCGRPGLAAWLQGFQLNLWEFAHQRSPEWESPDGRGSRPEWQTLNTPALDYLVALDVLH